MGDAIGQILPLAIGVALSPVPIIAVVLMLATPRARSNGPAFVAGWIAGLSVVGGVVLLAAGATDTGGTGDPATWVSVLKLVLGALLWLVAIRQWRHRPRGDQPGELPAWMRTVDRFKPARAAAIAAALAGLNPKNLLLTVGAAAAIAQAGTSTGDEVAALAVYVLIATLGPGVPVGIYFAMGDRAGRMLGDLKTWLATHNAAIMAALCIVIGAKLLGDGISGLA